MGKVSMVITLKDFKETVTLIHGLKPISAKHGKFECFGIVPCGFESKAHPYLRYVGWEELDRENGVYYRKGKDEIDRVPFVYIDIDNNRADRKPIALTKITKIIQAKYGWNYAASTTYSHSASKDKFRLLIETDRDATRSEIRRIGIYLNETLFGGQADTSIYDPADFIFGPSHNSKIREYFGGSALKVDDVLREADALIASKPYLLAEAIKMRNVAPAGHGRSRKLTGAVDRDMSVDPECNIHNRDIFNPAWIEAYALCGSHWKTMRRVMGSVWLKTEGALTYGEMDALLRGLDATKGNYFTNKYGEHGIQAMLDWFFTLPVGAANDDWKPILECEPVDLVVDVKEAACGEGKTYSEIDRMLTERGRYIYASPKKADNRERAREFRREAKKRGIKFEVITVDSDNCENVAARFRLITKEKIANLKKKPTVIFTTHLGLMMNKWHGWEDFEAIIDEAAEVFKSFPFDASNNQQLIKEHLAVKGSDGDCYRLRLTSKGRDAFGKKGKLNVYGRLHLPILREAKARNCSMWVKKEQWDSEDSRLDFFSLFTPLNLVGFRSVRLMADEAFKSPLVKLWAAKWSVAFKPVADFTPRKRLVPTGQRTTIKYFSESKDASKKLFAKDDPELLNAVSDAIKNDAGKTPVLWTANLGLKDNVGLSDKGYITPKSHGRNDLQDYTAVAWLAAMRPNPTDKSLLLGICGMSEQEITDWREYNSAYQAVMRTNLRDFVSDVAVTIYVFSKKQADYLHTRLGGEVISLAHTLPTSHAKTVAPKAAPISEAQRRQRDRWVDKMLDAGVTKWHELPVTKTKLNVNPMLIPLIEARAAGLRDDDEKAA